MAIKDQIAGLYVGYFNRGADPEGLNYWVTQANNGMSMEAIANFFASSTEATSLYPYLAAPSLNAGITEFLTAVYQNLFERAPDAEGLAFWTAQLVGGMPAGEAILEIMGGAQGQDKVVLDNKTVVSTYYADTFLVHGDGPWTAANDLANAQDALAGDRDFWTSPDAIPDGMVHVDELVAASFDTTFELTTGVDHFTGGPGTNIFDAPLSVGIDGLVAVQTLQGPDVLIGGGTFDVLNAELNNTGTTQNPTISGIPIYNLTSFDAPLGLGSGNLDLDRASGYEELWNVDSRADLTLINVRPVDGEGVAPLLGLRGVLESEYNVVYDTVEITHQTVVAQNVGTEFAEVDLDIDGVVGNIETLELIVSDGVYLDLEDEASEIENLVISGSGILELNGEDDFPNLVTLDSTDYTGDLDLDVGGSTVLTSVLTGLGNDRIEVNHAAVDVDLSVDLGGGVNILAIDSGGWWDLDSSDINGLNFTGGVANVQVLAFDDDVDLNGNATLNLAGFDESLALIQFDQDLDGDGWTLTLANAPETLQINVAGHLDWLHLNTGNVVNLSIAVEGNELDLDSLSGPVGPPVLEHLTLETVPSATINGDIYLDVDSGDNVGALQTVMVDSADDADVDFVVSGGSPDGLDALTTIDVIADGDARLSLTGLAGTMFVAGTHATQTFEINVTGAGNFLSSTSAGNVWFNSSDLPGGIVETDYSTTVILGGTTSFLHDIGAASDVAADLDAVLGLSASSGFLDNTIDVTWDAFGPVDPLSFFAPASGATQGTLNSVTQTSFVQGIAQVEMVEGQGFDGLETVNVHAGTGANDDADVELTDVYGLFALDISAGDDAFVDLVNTNATSVLINVGDHIDLDIGDETVGTIGNRSLQTATVAGHSATVTLEDNLASFTTLDASGVQGGIGSSLTMDVSEADYAPGAVVTYMIGAAETVTSDANVAREIFDFVGSDIGNVEITDFTAGADPLTGDRLDLSSFGFTGAGELVFTNDSGNLVITDLAGGSGDFSGAITLVGLGADAMDVATFNIIYA